MILSSGISCLLFCPLHWPQPLKSLQWLNPVEKYWRIHGVNVALFLDDGWLIAFDRVSRAALAVCVRSDLRKAGFITNDEKSQWSPCQVIDCMARNLGHLSPRSGMRVSS